MWTNSRNIFRELCSKTLLRKHNKNKTYFQNNTEKVFFFSFCNTIQLPSIMENWMKELKQLQFCKFSSTFPTFRKPLRKCQITLKLKRHSYKLLIPRVRPYATIYVNEFLRKNFRNKRNQAMWLCKCKGLSVYVCIYKHICVCVCVYMCTCMDATEQSQDTIAENTSISLESLVYPFAHGCIRKIQHKHIYICSSTNTCINTGTLTFMLTTRKSESSRHTQSKAV